MHAVVGLALTLGRDQLQPIREYPVLAVRNVAALDADDGERQVARRPRRLGSGTSTGSSLGTARTFRAVNFGR